MGNHIQRGDIYALRDPFTMRIRYVGASADPVKRLAGHIQAARQVKGYRQPVVKWIKGLLDDGSKPELMILQRDSRRAGYDELLWIGRLWRGFLFNCDRDIHWGMMHWFNRRYPNVSCSKREKLLCAWRDRINAENGWMINSDGKWVHESELEGVA